MTLRKSTNYIISFALLAASISFIGYDAGITGAVIGGGKTSFLSIFGFILLMISILVTTMTATREETIEKSQLIREYSKKHHQDRRDELAKELKAYRHQYFGQIGEIEKRRKGVTEERIGLEKVLNETDEQIENKKERINHLSRNRWRRFWNSKKVKSIDKSISLSETAKEYAQDSVDRNIQKEKEIIEEKNYINKPNIEEDIERFYKDMRKEWKKEEYNKEEAKKYFSKDFLKNLDLDEYVVLLQRFPDVTTHVTRQSIRDHTGHMWHTEGLNEYATGLVEILEDGKIRGIIDRIYNEKDIEPEMIKLLTPYVDSNDNFEEALESLIIKLRGENTHQSSYADLKAVHFATNKVADTYYGSEKTNEVFFAFPSQHIASNYKFDSDFTSEGGFWNDNWVWTGDDKGVSVDAGILFLPKNTLVDPETGSRYELNELEPTVNTEYINQIKNLTKQEWFGDLAENIKGVMARHHSIYDLKGEEKEILEIQRERLYNFGIKNKKLQDSLLTYSFIDTLNRERDGEELNQRIEEGLRDHGIFYIEDKDTISSQEYWTNFFEQNPEIKPKRIVFYEGNPTEGLEKWQKSVGAEVPYNRDYNKEEYFPENIRDRHSEEANEGLEEFIQQITPVLKKMYDGKEIKRKAS